MNANSFKPWTIQILPYEPAMAQAAYHQVQRHCWSELHMLKGHQYHWQVRPWLLLEPSDQSTCCQTVEGMCRKGIEGWKKVLRT